MKTKKRFIKTIITSVLLLGFLGGCGTYATNRRDGTGPRRDGSGNGPCTWGSSAIESPALMAEVRV